MKNTQEELKRLRELSALHEISKYMQTFDLDKILHLILDGVTRVIGFDRTRLYLINEEENQLECKMAVGIEKEKIKNISLPLERNSSMVAVSVIERRAFIVEDALNDARVNKDLKELFGLKSFAVVPLIGRDKTLGAITADNLVSDRIITAEKLESLITFANQAGIALENAKMYDQLKAFNYKLEERIKIATENLRKTQSELIQSEKLAALGKLSAGIAHEIRNPLTSIKLLMRSLGEKIEDNEMVKDIKIVEDEIERVDQIISRFLDFSRPEKPSFSAADINEILEETLNLVFGKIKENNIRVEKRFEPLPMIQSDKAQIKQVFLNLFLNAIQVMGEGRKLEIETKKKNDKIQIKIQDEGEGISIAVKNKLFEPFFTTKEEGIGLGLSIVKRIIDEHGGSIKADNAYPKGAVFTIELPIKIGDLKNDG